MTTKPESRRQRRIRAAIQAQFPLAWFFKVHGNEYQPSGIPDLIGTVDGLFFAFEVKEPDGDPSEIQLETIDDIRKAGGVAAVIVEPWEAIALIQEARRLSAGGSHLFGGKGWIRSILRATYRKDVDRRGIGRVPKRRNRTVRSPIK